jgi:hypothetical protein
LFDMDETDTLTIPERGGKMGYNGSNIGYWREDRENCRFFVRNYAYLQSSGLVQDTTSDLVTKVVIRYKSNGLDCSKDLCVPVEAKDLLVALVYYKFICKNIPVQVTADGKDRQERLVNTLQDKYQSLLYEPKDFWEIKDAIYGSLNATARR